jgi:hypothetical protein
MPSHRPRSVVPLLFTPAALRAQALVILATLQVGLTAALSVPAAPAAVAKPRPGALDLAVAFADVTRSDAMLAHARTVPSPKPTVRSAPGPVTKAAPKPVPAKTGKAARYIPSGTGMWTYQWAETEGGSARRVVAKAKAAGLTHLYVRTGTRQGGFDGGPVLKKLLPATQGTGIRVIAWDFPQLKHPVSDAHRLAAAAAYRVPGAPRVAAVAPDIETGSEGTHLTNAKVDVYLKTLRHLLPADVAIIGVTPWPSEKRLGRYPFGGVAKWSDALAPMAYWVNRDSATVGRQTMQRLAKYGKPVMPIGQAYDPRIDVPGLHVGPPSRGAVTAFLKTTSKLGAPAASLWVWQFASQGQWQALDSGQKLFPKAPR